MVRMVTRGLAAMLVLSSVLAAVAQDNPAPGGPPGGGGFGRGGGMIGRMIGGSLDDLQKELSLTPEQREKINGIVDKTGETIRAKFEEARNGGDWGAMRTEMEKITTEAIDKVKGTLTPEQTEKFTKIVNERRNNMAGFMGRGGDRGGSPEQRVSRAMEALKITDATEAEAVKSLISKIAKLQSDIATQDRTARDKAGEILKNDGMADDALEARLKEFRTQRKALDDQLLQAQEELRKVVSARQEVELFRQSFLR
jgi:Spy/CpxP family protein refolding chaperone